MVNIRTPAQRREQRKEKKIQEQEAGSGALRDKLFVDPLFKPRSVFSQRNSENKMTVGSYLIVCEDSKSGLHYLQDLVDDMQLSYVKFVSSAEKGRTDPQSVVRYAEDEISKDKNILKAFVVFDGDIALRGGSEKNKFDSAVSKASDNDKIELFVSVPCLEFWFVLHYVYRDTAYQKMAGNFSCCDSVGKELSTLISDGRGYDKSEKEIYDRLQKDRRANRDQAVQFAQKLREQNFGKRLFLNPSTDMDRLIEKLKALS
ncbi:MAG: RloB family protein [Magnetococcus sp. DMHC-6]